MAWTEFTYLFVIALFCAGLDAFMIGANDVANSWATSVSSRSLTLKQALLGAAILEFLGAVLVGARVAGTIRNNIIDIRVFNQDAGVILLAFTCVTVGASTWLTIATFNGMPVSTTHTVIGAIIGVGIAVGGGGAVRWGWNGVAQIIASWFIAPGVAGGLAAIVFLLCKFCILRRKNPKKLAVLASPIFFFVVPCVLTTSIIVKGSPSLNLDELPPNQTAAAILGTGAVCCALSVLFYLPWLYVQVIRKDYTVRWWHFFYGPLLWRRQPPADAEEKMAVPDYYLGHHNDKDVFNPTPAQDPEAMHRANSDDNVSGEGKEITVDQLTEQHPATLAAVEEQYSSATHDRYGRPLPPKYRHYEGSAIEPWNAVIVLRYNALPWLIHSLTAGVRTDIHKAQATQGASEKEILRLRRVHAHAEHFDNEAEHAFSFLQVLTACTASFAHGANDVANAIAPLTVVYSVWSSAEFPSSREPVPIWILVYGGAMISIGLGIYGWRMMAVLGNRLTLHSPSRGFSMEFGASITVVLASYLALPVSTTQSITGATLAVSLCEGTWRSTNWKGFAWVFMSWVYTLPCAGLISGLLMAIVLNAPGWGTDVGIRP